MQRYFLLYLKEWRTDRKKESQSAPAANWPYSHSYLTSFQCWVYSSDCEEIRSPFIYIKHQFRNWARNEAGGLQLIGRSMIKYPSDFAAIEEWQRNFPTDKYALHSNSHSRVEFQWFPIDLFAQVRQRPFLIKISFIFILRFVLTFSGIQALQLTFYRKHTAVPLGWIWCQKAKAKNKEKQKLTEVDGCHQRRYFSCAYLLSLSLLRTPQSRACSMLYIYVA